MLYMDRITRRVFELPAWKETAGADTKVLYGTYMEQMMELNGISQAPKYMMPIYESSAIADLRTRRGILYSLKEKLTAAEPLVLNIRVGGNDLSHLYGFRREPDESIHQIGPVSNIFTDIVTVYGTDYVISGPVWEYYSGNMWETGLRREIKEDKLCGFTGKTVIHPNQIRVLYSFIRSPSRLPDT